jgi:hypothetical protein
MATRIDLLPVVFGLLIVTLYAWFNGYTDFPMRFLYEFGNAFAPKELPKRHLSPVILLLGAVSRVSRLQFFGHGVLGSLF